MCVNVCPFYWGNITDILLAARLLLKPHTVSLHTEHDPAAIPNLLKNDSYDIILLDMNFDRDATSGREGFHWLESILRMDPSAVVILMTAFGDVDLAVRAIKQGATDFILKPWQNEKLLATLSSAMKLRQSRMEVNHLLSQQQQMNADRDQPYHDIIGVSPAMQQVFATIRKVAATDANVLLLGENGTGKELVARALHRQSQRSNNVFIPVDMGAISETLFESELFGHVKGAFTDAHQDRAGRFETASGGTLFLDEIGNLPPLLQVKLLTVLESRTVRRVGSNKTVDFDVRLICATNRDLLQAVPSGGFRQDLLYRINTVEISLPPLRARLEDIPLLAQHFFALYQKRYSKPVLRLLPDAVETLQRYHWPGNIRELRHAIERAVILCDAPVVDAGHFLLTKRNDAKTDGLTLDDFNLESVEKKVVRKAIEKHGGNISHAAKELGVTRSALYRRIEKYGL